MPHIILIILSIVAWIVSTSQVLQNNMHVGSYLINMCWSIFNFVGALISIKVAYQKPIFRLSERIPISDDIYIDLYDELGNIVSGKLLDISEKGAGILLNKEMLKDNILNVSDKVKLKLSNHYFNCTVCRFNGNTLGLKFENLTPREMKLIMSIFTKYMQPYYDNKKVQNYIINEEESKYECCA